MQATQHISRQQLAEIVQTIFGQGEVIVKEAISRFDSPTNVFSDADALNGDWDDATSGFRFYSIYYPDAGGHVYERRIELTQENCDGHTHRFKQEGWGLIRLQCRSRDQDMIECNIAVNSEVRSTNWRDTCPDLKDPAEWDWNIVNSKAGRLVRLLRKLGKIASSNTAQPDGEDT